MRILKPLILLGNGIFILWVLYNAIDEGFKSVRTVQAAALLFLIVLLIANSILVFRSK